MTIEEKFRGMGATKTDSTTATPVTVETKNSGTPKPNENPGNAAKVFEESIAFNDITVIESLKGVVVACIVFLVLIFLYKHFA